MTMHMLACDPAAAVRVACLGLSAAERASPSVNGVEQWPEAIEQTYRDALAQHRREASELESTVETVLTECQVAAESAGAESWLNAIDSLDEDDRNSVHAAVGGARLEFDGLRQVLASHQHLYRRFLEMFMAQASLPMYTAARTRLTQTHKAVQQHEKLLESLSEVRRRFDAGDLESVQAFSSDLMPWFAVHAQTMDAPLAEFLKGN